MYDVNIRIKQQTMNYASLGLICWYPITQWSHCFVDRVLVNCIQGQWGKQLPPNDIPHWFVNYFHFSSFPQKKFYLHRASRIRSLLCQFGAMVFWPRYERMFALLLWWLSWKFQSLSCSSRLWETLLARLSSGQLPCPWLLGVLWTWLHIWWRR